MKSANPRVNGGPDPPSTRGATWENKFCSLHRPVVFVSALAVQRGGAHGRMHMDKQHLPLCASCWCFSLEHAPLRVQSAELGFHVCKLLSEAKQLGSQQEKPVVARHENTETALRS